MSEPQFLAHRGTWRHTVESPYVGAPAVVEVLLPDRLDPARRHRVLYVLPVEAGDNSAQFTFGDGLMEVRRLDLHNRHGLVCVSPHFDTLPWYGAHSDNPLIRHEDHLTRVVVPLIDQCHPVIARPGGRLLLGFSKSGWGAFTLILRNPGVFGYAASWDAPLMLTEEAFGVFGTSGHFGTRENFARYLPATLMQDHAAAFRGAERLVLTGFAAFGPEPRARYHGPPHVVAAHDRMVALGIPHAYNNDIRKHHHWESGWVAPVAELLVAMAERG